MLSNFEAYNLVDKAHEIGQIASIDLGGLL